MTTSDDSSQLPWSDSTDAFRRFSRDESRMLKAYVKDSRSLASMRFMEQYTGTFTLTLGGTNHGASDAYDPDDEVLVAFSARFRQLYNHNEPGSFKKIVDLLKANARDRSGPSSADAIEFLRGYEALEKKAIKSGLGGAFIVGGHKFSNREIIDSYLHGEILHRHNEKSQKVEVLDRIPTLPRQTFHTVLFELTRQYTTLANFADLLLKTRGLQA